MSYNLKNKKQNKTKNADMVPQIYGECTCGLISKVEFLACAHEHLAKSSLPILIIFNKGENNVKTNLAPLCESNYPFYKKLNCSCD